MRVAVVGSTGKIGRRCVEALRHEGHEPVAISRSNGIDAATGQGLDAALKDVDAVIDAANTSATDPTEIVAFFRDTTANLLAAEQRAGVRHHVLLSIAVIHRVHGTAHYEGKRTQESLVAASPIASTIVAATQFFDFPLMISSWTRHGDRASLAPLLLQPVAPDDVAEILAAVAVGAPQGRFDFAGPQAQDAVDMARRIFDVRGETVELVPTWDGVFGVEMAGRAMLPDEHARIGATTFDQWLASDGPLERTFETGASPGRVAPRHGVRSGD